MAIGRWIIIFFTICVSGSDWNAAPGADEFSGSNRLLDQAEILPVDEAFSLTATKTSDAVQLYWQIMPGYYLYRHRLKATSEVSLGEFSMSPGLGKHDEYFGDVEVYYGELNVDIPINEGSGDSFWLDVEYQGCADAGICYPPVKKRLSP